MTTFHVHYDADVKAAKKVMHVGFNRAAVAAYAGAQERAAQLLCRRLRESPKGYVEHLREYALLSPPLGVVVCSADARL